MNDTQRNTTQEDSEDSLNLIVFDVFIPLSKATDYYKKVHGVVEE